MLRSVLEMQNGLLILVTSLLCFSPCCAVLTSRGEEVQRLVDGTASDLQKSELVTVCTHPGFAIAIPFVTSGPENLVSS